MSYIWRGNEYKNPIFVICGWYIYCLYLLIIPWIAMSIIFGAQIIKQK